MPIAFRTSGHVAEIVLSAESGNRIGLDAAFALSDHATEIRQNDDIWATLLTAEGSDFCAGTSADALDSLKRDDSLTGLLRVARIVAEIEKPVICAVQGEVYEQGLELALACDLRIADRTARFRMAQALDGGIPWDGGTQRLPRTIGRSRAVEMLLTGRVIGADEARMWGLVGEVVDEGGARARAVELSRTVTSHAPIALEYLKEAVYTGMDGPLADGLRMEADLSFLLQSTSDRSEGIASFLERRPPEYGSR